MLVVLETDEGFIARSPDAPKLVAYGPTELAAIYIFAGVLAHWIESVAKKGFFQ